MTPKQVQEDQESMKRSIEAWKEECERVKCLRNNQNHGPKSHDSSKGQDDSKEHDVPKQHHAKRHNDLKGHDPTKEVQVNNQEKGTYTKKHGVPKEKGASTKKETVRKCLLT
ncbi:hypothetical protein V6N13_063763 [Hibiscus sabdariffa]